jgi:dolichyl-diphosphooligosaccharide--protein glycosyltransferase/undecaprenyl-diphosphooligosaccharide--protein glycosyltransferase
VAKVSCVQKLKEIGMNIFDIQENKLSLKMTVLIILATFIFSILCRLIWVNQFSGEETFIWNNQLMINTNDGYYFAEGAKDIVAGDYSDQRSPTNTFVSQLTAFFVEVFSFSLETVILYLPAFLSSLIVIPMVLIGRTLGNTYLGGVAALLSAVTWSYYNRTMVGYYDTDMLNIVFPMFILLGMVLAIKTEHVRYILTSIVSIILYQYWYTASYSLIIGLIVMFALYLVIKDRQNKQNYLMIALLLFSLATIPVALKIVLVVGIYLLFHFFKEKALQGVYIVLGVAFIVVLVTGGFNPILNNLKLYIFRESLVTNADNIQLHYFSVTQTVREAGQISFETFANRISGHTITFVLSIIGYILLLIRYPLMILSLPMVVLGFIAQQAGLRFTVYAVPIMGFGFAYLVFLISKSFITDKKLKLAFVLVSIFIALYPNIQHIVDYKVPTVFKKDEVQILDQLGKIAKPNDYVVAWWDYGYPIRFYANVNTLIDGGLHSGNLNFPVSFALTNDQLSAANMARLSVEYTKNKKSDFRDMMLDYNVTNANRFLTQLRSKTFTLPEKSSDIYFYLPYRMLNIFPTVAKFSNINLMSGKQERQVYFFPSSVASQQNGKVILRNGIIYDAIKGEVAVSSKTFKVYRVDAVRQLSNGQSSVESNLHSISGDFCIVYMQSYGQMVVMDRKTYESTYVQMFMLGKYDKELFELVIASPYTKIFKLKK